MKVKYLSIVVMLGISTSASALNVYKDKSNSLDIYGRIEWQIANGKGSFADNDARSQLGGRLGVYLTRDISLFEDTKIVGRLEWQVRTEKDDNKTKDKDLDARYAYIGLSHAKYGELIAGRTKNPLYQVMKITDKYKNFTPNVYNFGLSSIDDSYQFNRQDGTLQWNGEFAKNEIQLAYVTGNGNSDNKTLDYGMMASYRTTFKLGDVKISPGLAASQYNREKEITATDGRRKHRQLMGGVQVDYSDLSLGVTVGKTSIKRDNKSDNDFIGMDTVLSYDFGDVKLLGGYSFLDEDGKHIYEKEDWRVETQLTLAKKTYLSVTYDKEVANKNKRTNNDAVILGLRYDF